MKKEGVFQTLPPSGQFWFQKDLMEERNLLQLWINFLPFVVCEREVLTENVNIK